MKNSDEKISISAHRLSRITIYSYFYWFDMLEYIASKYNTIDIIAVFMDIENDEKLYDRVLAETMVMRLFGDKK